MVGNNEIILNEATMIAAVQFWFESKFKDGAAPKVVSVARGGNAHSGEFKIGLQSPSSAAD